MTPSSIIIPEGIPQALRDLLEELRDIDDTYLRSELLIEYGAGFQEVPERIASRPFPEVNKVPGCESEAYVFCERSPDATIVFYFAVENPQGISAKALASILGNTLSGAPLSEVKNISEEIAYIIFGRGLSMGKGLGLTSMIRMVRDIAVREELMHSLSQD
jgi:cysteine desulfuration protein SufE